MKLTKEDYMRFPKERLAELLAELVELDVIKNDKIEIQPSVTPSRITRPSGWGCDGTICTNPFHDCINCPNRFYTAGPAISTNVDIDTYLSAN